MDVSHAPPMAPRNEWEPFREEIGQRYHVGTLKSVKEYMETTYRFPDYSLSTWKKKIRIWGFDDKYNKASAIVNVAAHFDHCPGESSLVPYTLPSGREVSRKELQRYLRRRKQIYANGELVSTTLANAASSYKAVKSQRRPPQEVSRYTEATAKRRARQSRLVLRRLYAAFLFGQGFVRPTDLMTPKTVQNAITFLGALERCLLCSWEQNMWTVDDDGYIISTSSPVNANDGIEMVQQMKEALRFHKRGNIHKARVLLCQGILSFRAALMACPAQALRGLLDVLGMMAYSSMPEFIRLTTKWFQYFVGKAEGTYIGLRSLLGAISETHPEAILPLISEAWKVFSRSLEPLDERLAYFVTHGRIESIYEDLSLSRTDKAEALAKIFHDLEVRSTTGLDEIILCLDVLCLSFLGTGRFDEAERTAKEGLRLIERACNADQKLERSEFRINLHESEMKAFKAGLLRILAKLKESQGEIVEACRIAEEVVELRTFTKSKYEESLGYLADLQQQLGDEQAFLTTTQRYDRAIEGLMTKRLNEMHLDESEELNSLEEQDSSDRLSEDGDEMTLDLVVDADVERQFHDYMNGKPHRDGKPDQRHSEWQDGVETSVKQGLMLTVSDVEDLE